MKKSLVALAALAVGLCAAAAASVKQFAVGMGEKVDEAVASFLTQRGLMLFANQQTQHAKGIIPASAASGQEGVPLRATLTPTSFATTDVLEMLIIPPGLQVVDWAVDVDDLDSNGSPAAVFKVGVLNAGKTDLDTGNAIWKTGLTTAQAGGVARMDTLTALRAGSTSAARVVGIIPTTSSATFQSGTVGVTVWVKAGGSGL